MKKVLRRSAIPALKIAGVVAIIATVAGINFGSVKPVTAGIDAVIKGVVLSPTGTVLAFDCPPPPGSNLPPQKCGIGVEAMAGPDTPPAFSGTSLTNGSFSMNVTGGKKYKIEFHGPFDQMSMYTFPSLFVEIASGETKDLGTIKPTEKQGKITVSVVDGTTNAAVTGAVVSAFPMFGGPSEGGGEPHGPMFPSNCTSGADGMCVLKVDVGRFGINLDQRPESQYVYSGQPIEANCETATCNITGITIKVTKAGAEISGAVVTDSGQDIFFPGGVGARLVGSQDFQGFHGPIIPDGGVGPMPGPGGPGSQVKLGSKSKYTIKVPSAGGQYQLEVHAPPDVNYSLKEAVTVTVPPDGKVTKNLVVGADTSSIYGKVVSQSGFALSSCKSSGDKFGGKRFGEVFAHNEAKGKFAHAEIKEDCSYKLTLPAGEYQLGHHLNPDAGYINRPAPPEAITVPANTDVEKNITVIAGDRTISGQVFGADGTPLGNVWVEAGNEGEARKDFRSGGQEGPQGPKPGEFQGPGGTKDPEAMMKYCSEPKNATECKNFKLPPGATGPGGCTNMLECSQYCQKNQQICQEFDKGDHDNPGGPTKPTALGQGVKIAKTTATGRAHMLAEQTTEPSKGSDYNENVIRSGTQAGPDGKFSLSVTAGLFEVRAMLPPDKDTGGNIPPKAVTADMRTAKTANVVLQFRAAFGTMTGKVSLPNGSAAQHCFVHFWDESGGDGGAPCKQDGTYSLGYGVGKLHVSADSFSGNKPYMSDEEVISVTTEKSLSKNFQLKERSFKVPAAESKTFDASQQNTMTLDDGTELTFPAGSLDDSGNVTVSVSPTVDMKSTQNADPVGAGLSITATDANGQSITTFNSNITIKMKYDDDYVEEELGLNENLLSAKFKNDTTGAYEDPDSATSNTDNDTITVSASHLTTYTIVSPGGVNLKSVKVSSSGKNTKITINDTKTISLKGSKSTWNVGTATFGTQGQLIATSNMKSGGQVVIYDTNGKLKKKLTPFKGFKGGLNQVVDDVVAKTGSAPDGTSDIAVAPATDGPAQAVVYDLKNNKTSKVKTGEGIGKTTLNTAEITQAGFANLTTNFNDKTSKVFKLSKNKMVEAKVSASALKVKDGKVEKQVSSPKVKKVAPTCSASKSTTLTLTGTGFGTDPVVLWNAAAALAVKTVKDDQQIKITVNPSAVAVKSGVNTLTIVNSDGQAGVAVATCGT